jgi:membrane fusion protein (multidrug efflux system)
LQGLMNKKILAGTFVVLCALIGFTVYWSLYLKYDESTDNAYTQSHYAVISPKVTGYINKISVDDNQLIKKDLCMIIIDDSDYKASLESKEANVLAQDALLQSLNDKIDLQYAIIAKAKATVAKAKAELARTDKDLERSATLFEKGFAPRQQYDSLRADALSAEAAHREVQAALVSEEKQINCLKSSLLQQEALKKQAIADCALAHNNIINTKIIAPFDGVVGNRFAQIGQLVRPGMNLLTLVPANATYVVANFKETQISRMKAGHPVTLKIDAYPGDTFKGEVDSISPATGARFSLLPPDNATGNFTKIIQRVPVKIRLTEDKGKWDLLRPGLSVVATVHTR